MTKKIGVYIVDEDVMERQTFEVAAWYRLILITAGEYPILKQESFGNTYYCVKFGGTLIAEYMPSLFGGVPVGGPYDRHAKIGQDANYEKYFSLEDLRKDYRHAFLDE